MASPALWLLVLFPLVCGDDNYRSDGIMDRLSHGMKYATNFLGSESVALKVAEFVVRAFQNGNTSPPTPSRRPVALNDAYVDDVSGEESAAHEDRPEVDMNEAPSPMAPLRHLVRLFGLRPSQISAVAVNALVFVAQMISTFLAGPKRPGRPYRSEDPTTWILNKNSRRLQELIATAKNETLSDALEELIQKQGSEEETSCIRLLVCKVTPFVTRMQKVVFGQGAQTNGGEDMRGSATLYRHLPSAEEINVRSDVCEKRHKDCNLNA